MTTLLERAVDKIRDDLGITREEYQYNVRRARELFNGNTIWEGVRR